MTKFLKQHPNTQKRIAQSLLVEDLKAKNPKFDEKVVTLAGPDMQHILNMYRNEVISFETNKYIYMLQVMESARNNRLTVVRKNILDINISKFSCHIHATMIDLDLMCSLIDKNYQKILSSVRGLTKGTSFALTTANRGMKNNDAIARQNELFNEIGIKNPVSVRYGKSTLISWGVI